MQFIFSCNIYIEILVLSKSPCFLGVCHNFCILGRLTIICVTRIPWEKYFVTILKQKIEQYIETQCFTARVELLQVSGVAVESKRCCGFNIIILFIP